MMWTSKEVQYLQDNIGRLTQRQMAQALGRTYRGVKRAVQRFNLSEKQLPAAVWQKELRRLYRRGLSDPEIMRKTGWPLSTVWRRRQQLGLPGLAKNHKWLRRFRQLYKQGLCDGQIAYAFKITYNAAKMRRASLRLPPNPRTLNLPIVPRGNWQRERLYQQLRAQAV